MVKGEYDVIWNTDKTSCDMSVLNNDAGWLSLLNCLSNTDGNGHTVLLRCPLEALFETFFPEMNVRQHK